MTKTEQVYGGSLYELAAEEKLDKEILDELTQILAIFDENPDYWRFLSTLSIAKDQRCKALDEAFRGKVHPYVLNFLKLLCEKGAVSQLRGCVKEYRRRYNDDHGIVEVCAVTAVALTKELQKALRKKLEASLHKTVELSNRVEPSCMGGVRLELPGRQLDGTVQHRLDEIGRLLQS